jgi:hypothetical protein
MHQVCRTSNLAIGWAYAKQVEIVLMAARVLGQRLRAE